MTPEQMYAAIRRTVVTVAFLTPERDYRLRAGQAKARGRA